MRGGLAGPWVTGLCHAMERSQPGTGLTPQGERYSKGEKGRRRGGSRFQAVATLMRPDILVRSGTGAMPGVATDNGSLSVCPACRAIDHEHVEAVVGQAIEASELLERTS